MPGALTHSTYRSINTPYKQGCLVVLVLDIGASGAPTVNDSSSSGFAVTRGIAGTYTGTMAFGARGAVLGWNVVSNAAEAGLHVKIRTFSATAGTFTFDTYDTDANDVADDLPSGSQVHISFLLEGG